MSLRYELTSAGRSAETFSRPQLGQKEQLVARYEDVIAGVVAVPEITAGEADGVTWERTRLMGKQQEVSFADFSFPEGVSFPLVFRQTGHKFAEYYERYPVVRRYFPHLYLSREAPDNQNTQNTTRPVLVMDKVEGYEERTAGHEFDEYISDPDHFEQLCQEMFQIVNEIHAEPLLLHDIAPTDGHNVFYNTETGHFQPFDIDSIEESGWPHVRKFMDFINLADRVRANQVMDEKQVAYTARMIQIYRAKYPGTDLVYEEETTLGSHVLVTGPHEDDDTSIRPGDPEYGERYRFNINPMDKIGQPEGLPIRNIRRKGKNVYTIKPDLLEAVERNDLEQVRAILTKSRGELTDSEFVEAGA